MSVLGVVLGIIGLIASLLAFLAGIFGGIPAAVLGLLAVLLGFLSWKKSGKGVVSIAIGFVAVVLAVVITVSGINLAKNKYEEVKANPEKAPTLAKYLDKAEVQYGVIGLMMVTTDPEEDKVITKEVIALLEGKAPTAAATETAETVTETEAPAEETKQ